MVSNLYPVSMIFVLFNNYLATSSKHLEQSQWTLMIVPISFNYTWQISNLLVWQRSYCRESSFPYEGTTSSRGSTQEETRKIALGRNDWFPPDPVRCTSSKRSQLKRAWPASEHGGGAGERGQRASKAAARASTAAWASAASERAWRRRGRVRLASKHGGAGSTSERGWAWRLPRVYSPAPTRRVPGRARKAAGADLAWLHRKPWAMHGRRWRARSTDPWRPETTNSRRWIPLAVLVSSRSPISLLFALLAGSLYWPRLSWRFPYELQFLREVRPGRGWRCETC
jgi:hypothetical protein